MILVSAALAVIGIVILVIGGWIATNLWNLVSLPRHAFHEAIRRSGLDSLSTRALLGTILCSCAFALVLMVLGLWLVLVSFRLPS